MNRVPPGSRRDPLRTSQCSPKGCTVRAGSRRASFKVGSNERSECDPTPTVKAEGFCGPTEGTEGGIVTTISVIVGPKGPAEPARRALALRTTNRSARVALRAGHFRRSVADDCSQDQFSASYDQFMPISIKWWCFNSTFLDAFLLVFGSFSCFFLDLGP